MQAARWIRRGGVLWNCGMFVGRVSTFQAAFRRWLPSLASAVDALPVRPRRSLEQAMRRCYAALPVRSFDRDVLERYADVALVRARFSWDDVGSWDKQPLLRRILAPRLASQLAEPSGH